MLIQFIRILRASEVDQVMTTRISDIQLRDFNPQEHEEWLTRAINYLKSYPDISEVTCVNLYCIKNCRQKISFY